MGNTIGAGKATKYRCKIVVWDENPAGKFKRIKEAVGEVFEVPEDMAGRHFQAIMDLEWGALEYDLHIERTYEEVE